MPITPSKKDSFITAKDYLEGEQQAEERHEYVNGHVYAMAGASKRHNRIARNFMVFIPKNRRRILYCEFHYRTLLHPPIPTRFRPKRS